MALWVYIRNANCCCFCQIILISQMQPTNCCCYSKIDQKCILQIDAVIARLYWYHKCNLQIAAAIARLDEKCILLPLLQDDTTNAYYKLLLLLQDYTKNVYWKLLLLQSVAVTAKRCQICILETASEIQEIQCHLNSIYSLLSASPFEKRTETASVQQYFQFLQYKILILI